MLPIRLLLHAVVYKESQNIQTARLYKISLFVKGVYSPFDQRQFQSMYTVDQSVGIITRPTLRLGIRGAVILTLSLLEESFYQ